MGGLTSPAEHVLAIASNQPFEQSPTISCLIMHKGYKAFYLKSEKYYILRIRKIE